MNLDNSLHTYSVHDPARDKYVEDILKQLSYQVLQWGRGKRQIDKWTDRQTDRGKRERGGRKKKTRQNCTVCRHIIETGGLAISKNKRERKRGEKEERDGAGRGGKRIAKNLLKLVQKERPP